MDSSAQYLTLQLGEQEYAIDILSVQEIRSYEEPTHMGNVPSFIKGVVNLRGVIVPIVDLRLRLGLSPVDYNPLTSVIILKVQGIVVGAVVDAVSEVVSLTPEHLSGAPQREPAIDERFIIGLASVGERTLLVMNLQEIMDSVELGRI
jgi:purine-binding chemotaxis protein CheW